MPIFVYSGLGTSNEITADRNLGDIETHVFNLVFFTFRRFRRIYRLVTHGIGQELGHVVCLFVCLLVLLTHLVIISITLSLEGKISSETTTITNLSPVTFNAAPSLSFEKNASRCLTMQ